MFISTISTSQTVNDVAFSDIESDYITIFSYNKFLSNKLKVHVDFGQFNSIWKTKDTRFRGRDGKSIHFNSIAHVLNFFSDNGFNLIDINTYTFDATIGHTVYHSIIMRKNKKEK